MSRQAFALGDTLGPNNPTYFLRQAVSGQSASADYAQFLQPIEGVRSYAGQTITVLGWARRSSGSGNMAVELVQGFGTGGSPSSAVFVTPQTVTLTSSFAPFAVTMAVPSITGKTLGTNGNDYLSLNFWTSAGSTFNASTNSLGLQTIGVDLWGIHIRLGTWTAADAALYRPRDPGTELALCQRYYFKTLANAAAEILGSGYSNTTTTSQILTNFPTQMRTKPTALEQSGTATDYAVLHQNTTINCSGVATYTSANVVSARTTLTVAAGLTQGQGAMAYANNSSAYFAWSAEL
jgi:hypothetical protein